MHCTYVRNDPYRLQQMIFLSLQKEWMCKLLVMHSLWLHYVSLPNLILDMMDRLLLYKENITTFCLK